MIKTAGNNDPSDKNDGQNHRGFCPIMPVFSVR